MPVTWVDFVHPFCILSFVKLILYRRKLEVKSLIFVTADSCRIQLERLTQLLVSAFPGSTVYQHTSISHASGDVLHRNVDALFAADEHITRAEVVQMLQQRPELPVLLFSDMEELGYGQLSHADVAQKLRSLLL